MHRTELQGYYFGLWNKNQFFYVNMQKKINPNDKIILILNRISVIKFGLKDIVSEVSMNFHYHCRSARDIYVSG